jgi:hypothetical protein
MTKLLKFHISSIVLYEAGTRKLRNVHQIYLESCEMWCKRRAETTLTDHMRNEGLRKVKQDRNIQHKIKIRKANWISHTLSINCLLRNITE